MEIKIDKLSECYSYKNRLLDNCITIINNNEKYYYEFDLVNNEALVTTSSLLFIKDAVIKFHELNPFISKYYTSDRKYYQAFDDTFTFKLPIKIIQPSKFFINEDKLNEIGNYIDENHIFYVDIIDDEYVLLDDHTALRYLQANDYKMVNVVMKKASPEINDFVYICKEQNIKNITNLHVLPKEEYEEYWTNFVDSFNME